MPDALAPVQDAGSDYLQPFHGVIHDVDQDKEAGTVRLMLLRLQAAGEDGVNIVSLLTHETHSTDDLCRCLLNRTGRLNEATRQALGQTTSRRSATDLLVVESIAITPAYRGMRLSLLVIERIQRLLGRHGTITVLKAEPFHPEGEDMPQADQDRGRQALMRHYQSAGLLPVSDTGYLVMRTR